jgi:hypothetical protein
MLGKLWGKIAEALTPKPTVITLSVENYHVPDHLNEDGFRDIKKGEIYYDEYWEEWVVADRDLKCKAYAAIERPPELRE